MLCVLVLVTHVTSNIACGGSMLGCQRNTQKAVRVACRALLGDIHLIHAVCHRCRSRVSSISWLLRH